MDGGVITIKFEADVSALNKSLKETESTAQSIIKNIDTKSLDAYTKSINAQVKLINARTKETVANFRAQHPELVKLEDEYKKLSAEASKIRAAFNDAHPDIKEQQVEVSKISAEARKLRQENIANGKAVNDTGASLTTIAGTIGGIAGSSGKLSGAISSAAGAASKAVPWVAIVVAAIKVIIFSIKQIVNGIKSIISGIKKIAEGVKDVLKFAGKLAPAFAALVNPLGAIITQFSKWAGLSQKIKQIFSFNSILNFAKSCVEASSDLTEVQNIVETAFPNMTDEMETWSKKATALWGLNQKSAKEYAATLGLMAQSSGLAEKASYKLGTGLTAVTGDLASIYNMDQQAVYEKIRSGVIGGRTMAIAQLGINMSNANLQAYMTEKGIAENYSKLDNATKTAIRYNYVIEQTRKIQGDFVKTQGTWANQTRLLQQNIIALKSELGTFLVTALTPMIKVLNYLITYLTALVGKIRELLSSLGIKIQSAAAAGSGLGDIADGLDDIGDAASEAAGKVAKLTDGPFSEMHKLGANELGGGAGVLSAAFGGAGEGLLEYEGLSLKVIDSIKAKFENFLKSLKFDALINEFKRSVGLVKTWIESIKDAWNRAFNHDDKGTKWLQSIIDLLADIWGLINDISEDFQNVWNGGHGQTIFEKSLELATQINETVDKFVDKIRTALNKPSGHIGTVGVEPGTHGSPTNIPQGAMKETRELTWGEYLAESFYKMQEAALEAASAVGRLIDTILENVDVEKIVEGWCKFFNALADALNKLAEFLDNHPEIGEAIGKIITFIASHPTEILATVVAVIALKSAFGALGDILKGSVLIEIGKMLLGITGIQNTILLGLIPIIGLIAPAFIAAIGILYQTFKERIDAIWDDSKSLKDNILEVIKQLSIDILNKFYEIRDKISEVIENIKTFFGNAADWIKTNFIDKITGFFDGLVDKLGTIGSTIRTVLGYGSSLSNMTVSVGATSTRDWAKESLNKNYSGRHANGGVWAPNRPQLAVLGDHPSQTEYALTEGHLDAIANRMSMAIMRGMAGANQNSKQPIIVQIGNEEFKDYVVNAVNENNFRRN